MGLFDKFLDCFPIQNRTFRIIKPLLFPYHSLLYCYLLVQGHVIDTYHFDAVISTPTEHLINNNVVKRKEKPQFSKLFRLSDNLIITDSPLCEIR